MTSVCRNYMVYFYHKGDKTMLNVILSNFFTKTENISNKRITLVSTKNRTFPAKQRLIEKRKTESSKTVLSAYFENLNGLNKKEREYYGAI